MENFTLDKSIKSVLTIQDYQFLNDLKDTVRMFLFAVCQSDDHHLKRFRADLETSYHALNALIVTTFSQKSCVFLHDLYLIYCTLNRLNLSITVQDYHSKTDFIFDLGASVERLRQIISALSKPI